eukprot:m.295366 g.295366  ORF g.295366 m.295366 type:complete len:56 (+) comp57544_c0_seq1:58-225(+)
MGIPQMHQHDVVLLGRLSTYPVDSFHAYGPHSLIPFTLKSRLPRLPRLPCLPRLL